MSFKYIYFYNISDCPIYGAVSYTHLDVYKRQGRAFSAVFLIFLIFPAMCYISVIQMTDSLLHLLKNYFCLLYTSYRLPTLALPVTWAMVSSIRVCTPRVRP